MCPKKMGWTYVALTFLAEIPVFFFSDLNMGLMGLPYVLPAFLLAWIDEFPICQKITDVSPPEKGGNHHKIVGIPKIMDNNGSSHGFCLLTNSFPYFSTRGGKSQVMILDDDLFPSNDFRDEIEAKDGAAFFFE